MLALRLMVPKHNDRLPNNMLPMNNEQVWLYEKYLDSKNNLKNDRKTLIHCSLLAKKAKRQEHNIKFYLLTSKSKHVIPLGTQIQSLEENIQVRTVRCILFLPTKGAECI